MKINIKKSLHLTADLAAYVEKKLLPLAKFVKHFDETGEAEIWLEISRTTNHHKKGDVFKAAVDLRLPKKILRAEEYEKDVRTAIDKARNTLRLEIAKYKTQFTELTRKRESGS
jgi:ribosomal subunit interface protein